MAPPQARDWSAIGPRRGARFPDVVLPDQTGALVDLHAARGGKRALVLVHRSVEW